MVYRSVDSLDFKLSDLATLPLPRHVLMTSPEHFEVEYVINPHMVGNIGDVDQPAAMKQWTALRDTYAGLDLEVHTIAGTGGLPDMVFCANQSLPYPEPDGGSGNGGVILSRMFAPQRVPEVVHFDLYFDALGHRTHPLSSHSSLSFEGMGDAIWHPRRRLLWGGHGFRTDDSVYAQISEIASAPVVLLALVDADFYHLDTCFSVLDERTVLIYPGAFDETGLACIHHLFERVIESPEDDARNLFSCNSHCPDERRVIIQEGCETTCRLLSEAGYIPIEVDTSEFLKSGGSVFCMKLMYW